MPTRSEQVIRRYMQAVVIYQRAVVRSLGRFDADVSPEQSRRLQKRKERAERIYLELRAELTKMGTADSRNASRQEGVRDLVEG